MFVRVGADASAGIQGAVRVVPGPPNDRCEEATAVPLETPVAFETGEASPSPIPWTCPSGDWDDVWFRFQAAVTGPLRVQVCDPTNSLIPEVYSGDCTNLQSLACAATGGDCISRSAVFQAVGGVDYWVRVNDPNFNASGEILVTSQVLPANTECALAVDLTVGNPVAVDMTLAATSGSAWTVSSCSSGSWPGLFYRFVPTVSQRYVFRACFDTAGGELNLFEGVCNMSMFRACSGAICGSDPNQPGATLEADLVAGTPYLLRVAATQNSRPVGTLEVLQEAPPVNDDCASALPVSLGDTPFDSGFATGSGTPFGLCSGLGAPDPDPNDLWFRYNSINGGPTSLLLCDAPLVTVLSVYSGSDCASATPIECSITGGAPACGQSQGQRPGLLFSAVAGRDYLIRIGRNRSVGFAGTLTIREGSSSGSLGLPYCSGVPNVTGQPGVLSAVGSASVLANDLTLVATGLPQPSIVLFIVSRNQGFSPTPGGSFGNLCLAGPIGRHRGSGQVQAVNAQGEASLSVDLGFLPQGLQGVPALSGETWNWQAFYRDRSGGSTGTNFTNGVSVLLE
ncbi:MAG: hypothetical protein AAF196_21130 [Planctomycetota bacterium]